MFDPNNIFHALFIIPILNALIAVYKLFEVFRIPGALGFALIVLTVLIRFVLHPLTAKQLASTRKLAKLKPKLDELGKLHKDDKAQLQKEQLRLYQEAGINPAAGCLPLLLQMPILIALYNLFFQLLSNGNVADVVAAINKVVYFPLLHITNLDLTFLGINLALKPSDWQKHGVLLLSIPIITALLQYWQTKTMTPKDSSEPTGQAPHRDSGQALAKKDDSEKKDEKKEDMGAAMQKQMAIMMPLMIGFFAYSFPLGLSLYWNTFTVFGIIQQRHLNSKEG